jgi:tRNA U38,U39,U40 pseudouridine synthase TruA
VDTPNGATDYVTVSLKGSGFMIHQIRYMVGAAVSVAQVGNIG